MHVESVKYNVPDTQYGNEVWRAKHGYKEVHQHNPPARRNRDFKATPYGNAIGMPNYRHATPYLLLKHLSDFKHEEHHHPSKWIKSFMMGATTGLTLGSIWFFLSPINGFASQKLYAAVGERAWSGKSFR